MLLDDSKKEGKMSRATRALLSRLPFWHVEVQTPKYKGNSEQSVNVVISRAGAGARGYVAISLTQMTEAELLLFRETFLIAVDLALPSVRKLDIKAKEDLQNGAPDTDPRIYRGLPIVVANKERIGEHDQGIFDRYPNVFAGPTAHFFRSSAPKSDGDAVDVEESQDEECSDESSEGGES